MSNINIEEVIEQVTADISSESSTLIQEEPLTVPLTISNVSSTSDATTWYQTTDTISPGDPIYSSNTDELYINNSTINTGGIDMSSIRHGENVSLSSVIGDLTEKFKSVCRRSIESSELLQILSYIRKKADKDSLQLTVPEFIRFSMEYKLLQLSFVGSSTLGIINREGPMHFRTHMYKPYSSIYEGFKDILSSIPDSVVEVDMYKGVLSTFKEFDPLPEDEIVEILSSKDLAVSYLHSAISEVEHSYKYKTLIESQEDDLGILPPALIDEDDMDVIINEIPKILHQCVDIGANKYTHDLELRKKADETLCATIYGIPPMEFLMEQIKGHRWDVSSRRGASFNSQRLTVNIPNDNPALLQDLLGSTLEVKVPIIHNEGSLLTSRSHSMCRFGIRNVEHTYGHNGYETRVEVELIGQPTIDRSASTTVRESIEADDRRRRVLREAMSNSTLRHNLRAGDLYGEF